MTETRQSSFERCCRLCAQEQDVTIMIFSAEAEAILLQKKLNQYLLIEVEENDRLPKYICINCCTKLQTVCEFIDQAHEAQKILIQHSTALEEAETGQSDFTFQLEHDSSNDTNITKIEVSVDPTMVLQNSEDELINNNLFIQDVTHLHGVDCENVTIKLIKNSDVDEKHERGKTSKKSNLGDSDEKKNKPFPCRTCKRGFYTELALKNHSWTHITGKTDGHFTCKLCSEAFEQKCDYILHLKEHKDRTGPCTLCAKKFRTENTYKAHMAVHAGILNSFTCKECSLSFKTQANLKSHSIVHSSERPFICNFCQKSFKRKQDLKFHINQHTGEKPYKCPFCDKRFASYGNCYAHKNRIHSGKREGIIRKWSDKHKDQLQSRTILVSPLTSVKGVYKYKCRLCEHSFMRRDNYTYHMYKHTGDKPFQCSFCPEKFVTRNGLLLHHDKKHTTQDRPLALLTKNILLK